jgi:hypothetical protein
MNFIVVYIPLGYIPVNFRNRISQRYNIKKGSYFCKRIIYINYKAHIIERNVLLLLVMGEIINGIHVVKITISLWNLFSSKLRSYVHAFRNNDELCSTNQNAMLLDGRIVIIFVAVVHCKPRYYVEEIEGLIHLNRNVFGVLCAVVRQWCMHIP